MRTHRFAATQLPGAGAVAKRLAGQSTNGANVNHVAGQLGIHRITDEGLNFRVFTAVAHAKLHHTGHFLAKAHTARTVDAAAHFFHADERTHILVENHPFLFLIARRRAAIPHRQILQLALATLIANGAIQRVVDQQKLHHRLLGLDGLVALAADNHAVGDRRGTGRHRLGHLFNIHQAHAAVRRDAQFLVVAEVRNVRSCAFGSLHDHAALKDFHFLAVELDFNHFSFSPDQT